MSIVLVYTKNMEEVTKFPGFIDLLKESWRVYTQNFKIFLKIIGLSIAFLLIFVLFGAVLLALFSQTQLKAVMILIAIVSVLAILASQLWIQVSLLLTTKQILGKQSVTSIKALLKLSRPLILPYIGLSLVSMFLVLGGYALFVVPGIVLAIWFSLAIFVLVDEGRRGMDALLVSRDYIKGNVIKVLVRWILFGVVTWLATGLIPILLNGSKYEFFGTIYSLVTWLVVGPLSVIFGYLIYSAVRAQKPDLKVDLGRGRKIKYIAISSVGFVIIVLIITSLGIFFSRKPMIGDIVERTVSITGEVVCLPHKGTSGPTTLECAVGLMDAQDNYYGLKSENIDYSVLQVGKVVTVTGTQSAPEANNNYNIVGVINVMSVSDDIRIDTYEECIEAGYPVMESYPERCIAPNGESFTNPTQASSES